MHKTIVRKQKQDTIQNNFRISGRRIFLTYSKADPDMTVLYLLEILNKKCIYGQVEYVIAKELHNDGNTHFHVVLINNKKFEIKNPHLLDIEFKGETFHGNYQPVKYLMNTIEYVCKDKQYISNIPNLQDGKILDDKEFVLQRTKEVGYKQALLEYSEMFPKKALTSINTFKNNLKQIQALQESFDGDPLDTPFTMENFYLKGALAEWAKDPKQMSLMLVGKSGIGKTQFGTAFCKHNKWKTLLVNHIEDFQRIDKSYDAIIIDDSNFKDFSDTQKLAILDNSAAKTIKVMYQAVKKRKGVVTIILMNHMQHRDIYHLLKQQAYNRRVTIYEPKHPFMINLNINITNNIHNGDNNNYFSQNTQKVQTVKQNQEKQHKFLEENYKRNYDIYQNNEF